MATETMTKRQYNHWTDEEDAALRDGNAALALKRHSAVAVKARKNKLGLTGGSTIRHQWTDEENAFVANNLDTIRELTHDPNSEWAKWAAERNLTPNAIKTHLYALGLITNPRKKLPTERDDFRHYIIERVEEYAKNTEYTAEDWRKVLRQLCIRREV